MKEPRNPSIGVSELDKERELKLCNCELLGQSRSSAFVIVIAKLNLFNIIFCIKWDQTRLRLIGSYVSELVVSSTWVVMHFCWSQFQLHQCYIPFLHGMVHPITVYPSVEIKASENLPKVIVISFSALVVVSVDCDQFTTVFCTECVQCVFWLLIEALKQLAVSNMQTDWDVARERSNLRV